MSRRIDRPTYNQLNPFRIFVDLSYYASGDPNLRPQYTWSYEIAYTQQQFNVELNYSRTQNPITGLLIPTPNRITVQTAVNLTSGEYAGLTISAPVKITPWWNSINNFNLLYSTVKGFVAQTPVDATNLNLSLSTNHSFTIAKSWTGETNFSFNTGDKNGLIREKPIANLSAGIQKTIWNNKGTLKVSMTDILWKTWPRFNSYFTNYTERLWAIRDTRAVHLNFTYRFGNTKVQAARRRTTSSEEERRRAGGN